MDNIKSLKNLENIQELLAELPKFTYQEKLTGRLDRKQDDFTYETILEIVLWKTNRFPEVGNDLILKINNLRKGYNKDLADTILVELLSSKGFDLPMASTFLRFIDPNHFQIIDQRVYRVLNGRNLKIPFSKSKKIDLYNQYLNDLRGACEVHGIAFTESDRVFYLLDKHAKVNKDQKIKY